MKTLAAVTVAFLPGTFVASFFAMPLFHWDTTPVVSSRFWIYWAVAVPLTLVTLLIWVFWTRRQSAIHREQGKQARDELWDELEDADCMVWHPPTSQAMAYA